MLAQNRMRSPESAEIRRLGETLVFLIEKLKSTSFSIKIFDTKTFYNIEKKFIFKSSKLVK